MGIWQRLVGWLLGTRGKPRRPLKRPPPVSTPPPDLRGLTAEGAEGGHAAPLPPVATPSPSRPKARPTPRVEPAPIIVGLDFGTHSTKVMLRARGEPKAEVFVLEEPTASYPWFATPSIVRLAAERLFFGKHAVEMTGGTAYRSLKVRLLPPSTDNNDGDTFPPGPAPDMLVAFYLSWVLNSIKSQIHARHPHFAPRVFLNMAAPMNHFENEALRSRYLQIIQASWESVFGPRPCPAEQGVPFKELQAYFAPQLECEVANRSTRQFAVLPETVAPIVSLSLDPRMTPGVYMIVDMGAGTTEVSVNHVDERGADHRVVCYHDESVVLGGDNFEWIESRCAARRAEMTKKLIDDFLRVFRRTWYMGYRKDAANPATHDRWRTFRVLLAGGGARRTDVERAIHFARPHSGYPVGERCYEVQWHRPTGFIFRDGPDKAQEDLHALLSVAHGLSIPRQQWPDFFSPGEVDEQPPVEVMDRPPAYWYLCE